MKQHVIAIGLFGLLVFGAAAQHPSSTNQANRTISTSDNSFITKAAQGGMAEVELGRLAVERAESPQVKSFGQRMVTDHTKVNDELKALCTSKGITLPNTLDSKDEATKNRLSKLNGAAFDKAYMEDMVSDHKKDVSEFQHEADHGTDPDVKSFAGKTLPVLQQHLQLAEQTLPEAKKESK